ncbi:hypothetical protein QWY85_15505 [Neolewinella lacunae]|uniref:Peptidase M48 domain-containing protein n=1 Tax=Neolewinella lacunae TaxID=1517758 RepID=A0A923PJX2_9BACT|nr:hypothetical protein [Neolewinella lacunae]MBC6994056.1 hypothetical protein [Neolewinella lacunae]MDN3636073.1 hypothetical protein [Neolewinella lacunae]
MKSVTLFRIAPALLAFSCSWPLAPPGPEAAVSYAEVGEVSMPVASCALDTNFELVHHTGRRYLRYLVDQLAPGTGRPAESYSVEIMRDRRGLQQINAMTCSSSRLIWVSDKAYQELLNHEVALAFIVAHELAHGGDLRPGNVYATNVTLAERELLQILTYRQRSEVVADQHALDLMVRAGYSAPEVVAAAAFILSRPGAEHLLPASATHPAGYDRLQLLEYYAARQYGATVVAR